MPCLIGQPPGLVHHHQSGPIKWAASGISGNVATGLQRLFMTRPWLDERIVALQRR